MHEGKLETRDGRGTYASCGSDTRSANSGVRLIMTCMCLHPMQQGSTTKELAGYPLGSRNSSTRTETHYNHL